MQVASLLESGDDAFATISIDIDSKRHVKPLSQSSLPKKAASEDDFTAGKKRFKTLTKYSYSESGTKFIKVLLSDLSDMKNHPADKMKITFADRSFAVMVEDY